MTVNNFLAATILVGVSAFAKVAIAAEGFHCEQKKADGETTDIKDAKNRKDCKSKGGKWVKEHAHGHAAGEEGHGHAEKKDDKK